MTEQEEEFEQDTEEVVITKEHLTTVEAHTEYNEYDKYYSLIVRGKTSGVHSGCDWGHCIGVASIEEAEAETLQLTEEHNVWCDSWLEEATNIVHRKGEIFKSKIVFNGRLLNTDKKQQGLNQFFTKEATL